MSPRRPQQGSDPPRTPALTAKVVVENDTGSHRRRAKRLEREPVVRGSVLVPPTILPWERELLLPIAVEALTDFVEANEHATPDIDEKGK
jgi:hypothetical protein